MNKSDQNEKYNIPQNTIIRSISFRENKIKYPIQDKNIEIIQEDLIYFKNDILKDIKNTEKRLNQKYDIQYNGFQNRLEEMEKISNNLNQKLSILKETISNENIIKEKLSILEAFKVKCEENFISHDCRINNINTELNEAILKYDKIILDSILYPGIIGKNTQFETFHDLIDFLLININKIINEREKDLIEIRESRNRTEELVKTFRTRFDFYLNNINDFTNKLIKNAEKEINNKINNLNSEFSNSLKDFNQRIIINDGKIKDLSNNMMNSLEGNNNELNIKVAKEIMDINSKIENFDNKYNNYINDIDLIRQEIKNIKSILVDQLTKKENIKINNLFNHKEKNNLENNKNNNNIKNNNKLTNNNIEIILNNENIKTDFTNNINNKKPEFNEKKINKIKDKSNSINKQYIKGIIKFDKTNKTNINKTSSTQNIKINTYKIGFKEENLKENNNNSLYPKLHFNNKESITKKDEDLLESEESNDKIKSISSSNFYKNKNENNLVQISNDIIKTKNICKKSNNQNISNQNNSKGKNLKLSPNKKYHSYKLLNEDLTNMKIKKVDLTIQKDMDNNYNNNIFNFNNNYNNNYYNNNYEKDLKLINVIRYIKNENREGIKDFVIKNNLLESKKVQTPKIFKKINYIKGLKNSNSAINYERSALSDRQNSLSIIYNNIKKNNIYLKI